MAKIKRNNERVEIVKLDVLSKSMFTNIAYEDLVLIIRDAKNVIPNMRTKMLSHKLDSGDFFDNVENFIDNFLIEKNYRRDGDINSSVFNIMKVYLCVYYTIIYNNNNSISEETEGVFEEFFSKVFGDN